MSEVETTSPEIETEEGLSEEDMKGFNATPPGTNPAWNKPKEKAVVPKEDKKEEPKEVAPKAAEAVQEEKAAEARRKLKIKGRELEVDDAKYHEYAQKGAAATETWQEAAKMRKDAEDFFKRLEDDPGSVLRDPKLSDKMRKAAEEFLWEKIQDEQTSPEEKAQREAQSKAQKWDEQEKQKQQQIQHQQEEQENSFLMEDYDKKVTTALTNSRLPKTTGTVRRMVDYLTQDIEAGVNRDPSEYADAVYSDYMQDVSELFEPMEGDQIMKILGEKILKKIRESDIKRLKTTTPESGYKFVPGKGMTKGEQKQKKLSGVEWERQLRREMMGR
jgi:hypothetical protein